MKKKSATRNAVPSPAAGKTLLIAAGGTGGHISPGVSIAERWLSEGGRIIFATLMKNIDYPDVVRLARNEAVTIVGYDAPRLTRNPLKLYSFLRRFRAALRLIRQVAVDEHADAVLGMGGYSSFPAVAFSLLNRKPLYLCEQNAHWGMVTRWARRFARGIFLSFPAGHSLDKKFVVTGNPLRAMFSSEGPQKVRRKAAQKQNILFIGGSQGATDINNLYLAFIAHPAAAKFHCTVAAGANAFNELKGKARKNDEILPFIEDMPAAYAAADFIVARCGSGVLFEVLWSKRPAFLIPYPFAADDHQKANAVAMASQMPCRIYDERPFQAEKALPAFADFLMHLPGARHAGQETRAEEQITRYILENLNHAKKI